MNVPIGKPDFQRLKRLTPQEFPDGFRIHDEFLRLRALLSQPLPRSNYTRSAEVCSGRLDDLLTRAEPNLLLLIALALQGGDAEA